MSQKMMVVIVSAALGLLVGVGAAYALAPAAELPDNVPSLGAPPMVPHDDYPDESCVRCHGAAASKTAGVPETPHPERKMCRQCHVPMSDQPLLVPNTWRK